MQKLILEYAGAARPEDTVGVRGPEGLPLSPSLFDRYHLCDKDGRRIVRGQRADFDDIVSWLRRHYMIHTALRKKLGVSTLFFRVAEDGPGRFCLRCIVSRSETTGAFPTLELYAGD